MAARFRLAIQWVAPSICRKLSKFNPSRDRRRRSSSKIFDDGFLDRGVPEAPRMIWDAVASENHLPFHLQVRGEFEYVKAKPLGDGFTGVPVREILGAVLRPFLENRLSIGAKLSARQRLHGPDDGNPGARN